MDAPEERVGFVEGFQCFVAEGAADGEERLGEGAAVVPGGCLESYGAFLLQGVLEDAVA